LKADIWKIETSKFPITGMTYGRDLCSGIKTGLFLCGAEAGEMNGMKNEAVVECSLRNGTDDEVLNEVNEPAASTWTY
jgi:hypothetical protein